MRLKPVPPAPDSLDEVATIRRAVPVTPGSEMDCCQRLMTRGGVSAQDDAREWLTFLRALGMAEETADGGFVRTRDPATDREAIANRFHEHVYGVREILTILSDRGPLPPEEVFDAYRPSIPTWERHRHEAWERIWRERVERILDWAVLLDLAQRTDGCYRRTDGLPQE